jgi:DNA-binding PadR family transcriptional regulator
MRKLTSFQRDLLVVLPNTPTNVLVVKDQLDEYYEKDVRVGRFFPNLDTLVEKNYAEITSSGEKYDEQEIFITEDGKEAISSHFEWRDNI